MPTFRWATFRHLKATSRILHSIKEVQKASDAALQRGLRGDFFSPISEGFNGSFIDVFDMI